MRNINSIALLEQEFWEKQGDSSQTEEQSDSCQAVVVPGLEHGCLLLLLFVAGIYMTDLSKALGIRSCAKSSLTSGQRVLIYTIISSEVRMFVVKRDGEESVVVSEESVVVKGSVPRSLKLQFKVLCIQKELEMSAVLENLIRKWIQADAPVPESPADLSDEDSEVVKGYVPKSLKLQFKVLCTQKRVKMCSVLYNLINEWVQAGSSTETRR